MSFPFVVDVQGESQHFDAGGPVLGVGLREALLGRLPLEADGCPTRYDLGPERQVGVRG